VGAELLGEDDVELEAQPTMKKLGATMRPRKERKFDFMGRIMREKSAVESQIG
jgi:hypothetical protein